MDIISATGLNNRETYRHDGSFNHLLLFAINHEHHHTRIMAYLSHIDNQLSSYCNFLIWAHGLGGMICVVRSCYGLNFVVDSDVICPSETAHLERFWTKSAIRMTCESLEVPRLSTSIITSRNRVYSVRVIAVTHIDSAHRRLRRHRHDSES